MPMIVGRRQQAEERREQILDAALRVFSEKGFAGASIRDIAREVGVTEGLLYHYFESKEQLLDTCWRERTWRAHLERILSEAGGKPVQQVLSELISDFLQTLRENGEMVRMCASEMQRNSEMAQFHIERIEDNQRLLTGFLRERQTAGEIREGIDLETPAGLLMGCAYSMFLLWGQADDQTWSPLAEGFVRSGVDVVMNGITPRS
jgi:TetR/AcrR family transcriptional regulator, cholesterol catabolism regulator